MGDLVSSTQEFWFNNVPGPYMLGDEKITRKEIQAYGGPIPRFGECSVCQEGEWLSRVRQKDVLQSHVCKVYNKSETIHGYCVLWSPRELAAKQGDEYWTQTHQNFEFAQCNRPELDALKCVGIFQKGGDMKYRFPRLSACDRWALAARRFLAQACQLTPVYDTTKIDWDLYDFAYFMLAEPTAEIRIDIPIPFIPFVGDMWYDRDGFMETLEYLQPPHVMTEYPSEFRRIYGSVLPAGVKVHFSPITPSQFYTRPNLGKKELDLISLGCDVSPPGGVYYPRFELNEQLRELDDKYSVMIHNKVGSYASICDGKTFGTTADDRWDYLNAFSVMISTARYCIFGEVLLATQPLFGKYYECLGSGAIPIFPESEDFGLLGIKPFEHYIPLSMVKNNNARLGDYLDNYEKYSYIAKNAVQWHEENIDRLLFDGFEDSVREITNYQYPRRLIDEER